MYIKKKGQIKDILIFTGGQIFSIIKYISDISLNLIDKIEKFLN